MLFASIAYVLALAAAGANAHGYVQQITCDGKTYKGGVPDETHPQSPIRSISTIDPYKDPKGSGITCGANAKAAAMTAPCTAGSTLALQWVAHPNDKWPHEMGPLITYMAKVPAGQTAAKVNPATLDFFKVQQTGQTAKGKNKWVVAEQMKLGTNYNVKIPKDIPSGEYIMRHEIIALHLADKKGGAEFYSSCFQLDIKGGTGSGTITPTAKFPGAYSATDKGIFTPKVFNSGFNYEFPGPAIPDFAANPGNSTDPAPTDAEPTDAEPTDAEPTDADPTPTDSSDPAEPTDDGCNDEDPAPTEPAAPTPTDDCSEDPEETSAAPTSTKSSKGSKPTGKHDEYRRRSHSWGKRMEKVYVGRS